MRIVTIILTAIGGISAAIALPPAIVRAFVEPLLPAWYIACTALAVWAAEFVCQRLRSLGRSLSDGES